MSAASVSDDWWSLAKALMKLLSNLSYDPVLFLSFPNLMEELAFSQEMKQCVSRQSVAADATRLATDASMRGREKFRCCLWQSSKWQSTQFDERKSGSRLSGVAGGALVSAALDRLSVGHWRDW